MLIRIGVLDLQKFPFDFYTIGISRQFSVIANDSVAGNNYRNWVLMGGSANSSGGLWLT